MGKKAKKTVKITAFMKFRKWFVTSIKDVTLPQWVVFIWTAAKVLFEMAQSLSILDRVILFITIIMQSYNWISNISDFVFGFTSGMLSFVICISGAFMAFSHVEIEKRILAAPALFFGLYMWGSILDFPTGAWLQGSVIGAFIAWIMAETRQLLEDMNQN